EGANSREYSALLRDLRDRALSGPLDPKEPPPPEFGDVRQVWDETYYPKYRDILGVNPVSEQALTCEQKKQNLEALKKCEEWERAERSRFEGLRQKLETVARDRAERTVPKGLDISLFGGGWSFLLEFSTVIVIIFALLVLGVIGQV